MRPEFGVPDVGCYRQPTSPFASAGFAYPLDGFHSVKPTRSFFVPRALMRFSLQRFKAFGRVAGPSRVLHPPVSFKRRLFWNRYRKRCHCHLRLRRFYPRPKPFVFAKAVNPTQTKCTLLRLDPYGRCSWPRTPLPGLQSLLHFSARRIGHLCSRGLTCQKRWPAVFPRHGPFDFSNLVVSLPAKTVVGNLRYCFVPESACLSPSH
jgi:hypothetical protein